MDSIVLKEEFKIEVIRNFNYAQLTVFIHELVKAINELEELKKIAVMCGNDVKAVELQGYVHCASHNKLVMEQVMVEKEEAVVMKEADIRPVFLN